ncbi:hypothetical protein FVE85_5583 [Porphyridium purpureum]|uniref:Uncharacterized protein n=1 Tax=Porphyridium purpureum TaxID=35688 RepID=A0A5J4Z449_PORPP|nr:hypothetical protein FVE85_5583 [Porphyridium purpureum]|eukprot:POR6955..scf295_1
MIGFHVPAYSDRAVAKVLHAPLVSRLSGARWRVGMAGARTIARRDAHRSVLRMSDDAVFKDSEWTLPLMPTVQSGWKGLWERKQETCRQVPGLPGVVYDPPLRIDDRTLLEICKQQTPDEWVNEIMWTLLGFVPPADGQAVSADEDAPRWVATEHVPEEWSPEVAGAPLPDFIGRPDCYEPEVDKPIKKAVQKLTRSIPKEYKALLKEDLGFKGFKIDELTPNRTRRATVVNWILYYQKAHGLR